MLITLVVHSQTDYAQWVTDAMKEANRQDAPETRAGKEAFQSLPCQGCHTIKGTAAGGKVGPELTYVASKKSIAGGILSPVNEENLTKWLQNPPAIKPGTLMPNLNLSPEQIKDLVSYLLTLKCPENSTTKCP
jgi:cytochrome c oxidase subunit 2